MDVVPAQLLQRIAVGACSGAELWGYVINIQPPTWVMAALIGIVASVGFVFALLTWGALSDAGSRLGSTFRRVLDIES